MNTIRSAPQRQFQFLDTVDEDDIVKSMRFRNAKFDEGVNTVQASVNAISQLPVITDEAKEYLNNKIHSIVTKANTTSGLDLSNSMTVKTLESDALNIYNDDYIVGAVSSAKNHINQSALITKYKTEPKLAANYGIANEDDYNNQLLKYKKDIAEGKNSVFSYQYKNFFDVEGNLKKDMKGLQADAYTELKGLYSNKVEEITPERIRAIVYNKLSSDPRYSEQLRINAGFKYKNSSIEDLIHEKNQEQREHHQYLVATKQPAVTELLH